MARENLVAFACVLGLVFTLGHVLLQRQSSGAGKETISFFYGDKEMTCEVQSGYARIATVVCPDGKEYTTSVYRSN